MKMMIEKDFMELVPTNETTPEPGKVWYITHHGVIHKQKGKLRVVFNCSMKYRGLSLNDLLMQGPDLTSSSVGVLLRFREISCAFTADIEKMFYQVRVPRHDRNFMRFFWYDHSDYHTILEYRMCVHVFGATSSPSIATYALQNTAKSDDLCVYSERAKNAILTNFYVDDLLCSVHNEFTAIDQINELKALAMSGGFNLTSFSSSSKLVLKSLNEKELSAKLQQVPLLNTDLPTDRTLGVVWNPSDDVLGFSDPLNKNQSENESLTKRNLLKSIASIYDPLGLAAPALIPGKSLFQECCRLKLSWDERLPINLVKRVSKWKQDITFLSSYNIPRCVKPFAVSIELHIFCDGSETAYGAVSYAKSLNSDNSINIVLLLTKSRLTPVSKSALTTVPRIEVCSAKLSADIFHKLKTEVTSKLDNCYFWTDSVTVLRYIKNEDKRLQRFVPNKVSHICHYANPNKWLIW